MALKNKEYVVVKGKIVPMNDAAFQLASKYFKATKDHPGEKFIPIELLKLPKLQTINIEKIKKEVVVIPEEIKTTGVEPIKIEPVVAVPVEVLKENVDKLAELAEFNAEVKKVVRAKPVKRVKK